MSTDLLIVLSVILALVVIAVLAAALILVRRDLEAISNGLATLAAALGEVEAQHLRPLEPAVKAINAQFDVIRRLYLHDPAPTLRALRTPTLAIFGAVDDNILAEKNRAAWESALSAGGHSDYTLRILPRANHLQLEARSGTNAEMRTLQRFVPEYVPTVDEWLTRHLFRAGSRTIAP